MKKINIDRFRKNKASWKDACELMGIKEFTSFFVMENQHAKFLKVTISG